MPANADEERTDDRVAPAEAEVKALVRGRGLDAASLPSRVGPLLRAAAGVAPGDDPALVRSKTGLLLRELCARLPGEYAAVARTALGIDHSGVLVGERYELLATTLDRTVRTVRRRADEAMRLLAEQVVAGPEVGDGQGWHLRRFHAHLRLDLPRVEVRELREVVAARSGLSRVEVPMSLPRHPDGPANRTIDAVVLSGGELEGVDRPSDSFFRFRVKFPAPLAAGASQVCELRLRVPPGQPMRPHYVFTPIRRCDEFLLRVRFPVDRPPRSVWRVEAASLRQVDDGVRTEQIPLDEAGGVTVRFEHPEIGLGHGVQWVL